jgi:hypothetical protein
VAGVVDRPVRVRVAADDGGSRLLDGDPARSVGDGRVAPVRLDVRLGEAAEARVYVVTARAPLLGDEHPDVELAAAAAGAYVTDGHLKDEVPIKQVELLQIRKRVGAFGGAVCVGRRWRGGDIAVSADGAGRYHREGD